MPRYDPLCKKTAPIVERVAAKYSEPVLRLDRIDVDRVYDEFVEHVKKYRVEHVPAILLLELVKNEYLIRERHESGAISEDELADLVKGRVSP